MSGPAMSDPLLALHLSASYRGGTGVLRDLSLQVRRGEIVGLVGQSGCGKSTLALALLRLLYLKGGSAVGSIQFNGRDLMALSEREMRELRGKEMALVLQSPIAALNPALRLGTQLMEAWKVHRHGSTRAECDGAIEGALRSVSLPSDRSFLRRYAAELSVGQAQRVLIGMAVLHRPLLLIADEPTSALDVITQADILHLFSKLSRELSMAILYISHDLPSVATISDRVAVMSEGQIVECRNTSDLFTCPAHPYTRRLINALPLPPRFAVAANF